jgi:hypothetical protein
MIRRGPGGGDLVVHRCRQCRKYDQTGDGKRFVHLEAEGAEMMAVLLKRIPALGKNDNHLRRAGVGGLKVVDSSFVWTEPNSMRMRVLLTLRAEVNDVTIQQRVKGKGRDHVVSSCVCVNIAPYHSIFFLIPIDALVLMG